VIKILLILIFLTGCSTDLYSWELNRAADFCKKFENISKFTVNSLNYNSTTCTDGRYLILKETQDSK
jgi:hypothetical protein